MDIPAESYRHHDLPPMPADTSPYEAAGLDSPYHLDDPESVDTSIIHCGREPGEPPDVIAGSEASTIPRPVSELAVPATETTNDAASSTATTDSSSDLSARVHEVHFFRAISDGPPRLARLPDDEIAEGRVAVAALLQTVRDTLLEQFPSQTDGMDIERVTGFIKDYGLRLAPAVVLREEQRMAVSTALSQVMTGEPEGDYGGAYSPATDIGFAFRMRDKEAYNGPEFSEATLAHELAHGSSRHCVSKVTILTPDRVGLDIPRQGQAIGAHRGNFLEEGFAELVRGDYITDVLGRPHGFADIPDELYAHIEDGIPVPISAKYMYINPQGNPDFVYTSFAGTAMGFLVRENPAIRDALLEARSSVAGLRGVAQQLNAIQPGLYKTLRDDFGHPATFHRGLRHVVDLLGIRY